MLYIEEIRYKNPGFHQVFSITHIRQLKHSVSIKLVTADKHILIYSTDDDNIDYENLTRAIISKKSYMIKVTYSGHNNRYVFSTSITKLKRKRVHS